MENCPRYNGAFCKYIREHGTENPCTILRRLGLISGNAYHYCLFNRALREQAREAQNYWRDVYTGRIKRKTEDEDIIIN
jgi:hypothetical protein